MSQSIIKITTSPGIVNVLEIFSISIKEVSCNNCSWEIDIPSNISVIAITSSRVHPQQLQEWVFIANTPGSYTLNFSYRKRCCGRPVLQKEQFTILVK